MEDGECLRLIPQASSTPFAAHTSAPSPIAPDTPGLYSQLYSNSLHPVLSNRGIMAEVASVIPASVVLQARRLYVQENNLV